MNGWTLGTQVGKITTYFKMVNGEIFVKAVSVIDDMSLVDCLVVVREVHLHPLWVPLMGMAKPLHYFSPIDIGYHFRMVSHHLINNHDDYYYYYCYYYHGSRSSILPLM